MIRGAALCHGLPEIASMAKSLSLLFRYSISERVLVQENQHLRLHLHTELGSKTSSSCSTASLGANELQNPEADAAASY